MKTRPHHIDLVEENRTEKLTFRQRAIIQLEMIQDHAYMLGMDMETAAIDWAESHWAKVFADHYPHPKK